MDIHRQMRIPLQQISSDLGAQLRRGQREGLIRAFCFNLEGLYTAAFDELNKFFTISGMPIASSSYWNSIHGGAPGEADLDEEGKRTMRVMARNMTFLMRSIALGREKYGLPKEEPRVWTNFIR